MKKQLYRIVTGILAVAWMCLIFSFSNQPATESSKVSGGCRLTVGGETKFACVDGPDFDGFQVDFDEAMKRGAMYKEFERKAYSEACNLFKKEVE